MSEDTAPAAISHERFRAILESYGSAPERWPEAERGPAMAHLVRSPEARELWESATALDEDLDVLTPPPPSPGLVQRILVGPDPSGTRHPRTERIRPRHPPWRLTFWPVALATIALVAFMAGLSVPSPLRGPGGADVAAPVAQTPEAPARPEDVEALAVVEGASGDLTTTSPATGELVGAPGLLREVPLL